MSNHYYLHCKATNEAVEVVASVGGKDGPRIEPEALGAFLAFHRATSHYELSLANVERFDDDAFPTIWNQSNFRELAGRDPKVILPS